jgi:predicted dehydrogenase
MSLRVGVVGCGLIGKRRALVARELGDSVTVVADLDVSRATKVADELGCEAVTDWQKVALSDNVDVVVVSTINRALHPIAIAAALAGKHVLCEKPLGRNHEEAKEMVKAAADAGVVLKTGFNHRHHPAVWKAHELCRQGTVGPVIFVRAIYGHGGRSGYEKEWRANAELAGGGELLDQGIHVIDLCNWFMGDFVQVFGAMATYSWDLGFFGDEMDRRQLEDNAFVLLQTSDGRTAQFHTSWTQWKNRFTFEVFGLNGYVLINGLGGSYGTETLTVGYRLPESGPPAEERFEFDGPDLSWQKEWLEFVKAIREKRQPLANGEDGLRAMTLIAAIYESALTGRMTQL